MKKILLSLAVMTIGYNINAQNVVSGGFRRAGTNAQIKAMHKKELKDSLGLTDAQANKVDAVEQNYKLKMRAVKMDTQISDADKRSKLAELKEERKTQLSQVISEEQIAKMDGVKKPSKAVKRVKKHSTHKKHKTKRS